MEPMQDLGRLTKGIDAYPRRYAYRINIRY